MYDSSIALSQEPFKAAIAALHALHAGTRETIRERLLRLAGAERRECHDFAFGDTEIFWVPQDWRFDHDFAVGYVGSGGPEVILFDDLGDRLMTWEGDVARELAGVGRLAGRERNDETAELNALDELWLAEREV